MIDFHEQKPAAEKSFTSAKHHSTLSSTKPSFNASQKPKHGAANSPPSWLSKFPPYSKPNVAAPRPAASSVPVVDLDNSPPSAQKHPNVNRLVQKPTSLDRLVHKTTSFDKPGQKPTSFDRIVQKPSTFDRFVQKPATFDRPLHKPANFDRPVQGSKSLNRPWQHSLDERIAHSRPDAADSETGISADGSSGKSVLPSSPQPPDIEGIDNSSKVKELRASTQKTTSSDNGSLNWNSFNGTSDIMKMIAQKMDKGQWTFHHGTEASIPDHNAEMQSLHDALQVHNSDLALKDEELSKIRESLAQKEGDLQKMQERAQKFSKFMTSLSNDMAVIKTDHYALNRECIQLQSFHKEMQSQSEALKAEVNGHELVLQDYKTKAKAELVEVEGRLKQLLVEYEDLNQRHRTNMALLEEEKEKSGNLERRLVIANENQELVRSSLELHKQTFQTEFAALQKSLESSVMLGQARPEIEQCMELLKGLHDQNDACTQDLGSMKHSFSLAANDLSDKLLELYVMQKHCLDTTLDNTHEMEQRVASLVTDSIAWQQSSNTQSELKMANNVLAQQLAKTEVLLTQSTNQRERLQMCEARLGQQVVSLQSEVQELKEQCFNSHQISNAARQTELESVGLRLRVSSLEQNLSVAERKHAVECETSRSLASDFRRVATELEQSKELASNLAQSEKDMRSSVAHQLEDSRKQWQSQADQARDLLRTQTDDALRTVNEEKDRLSEELRQAKTKLETAVSETDTLRSRLSAAEAKACQTPEAQDTTDTGQQNEASACPSGMTNSVDASSSKVQAEQDDTAPQENLGLLTRRDVPQSNTKIQRTPPTSRDGQNVTNDATAPGTAGNGIASLTTDCSSDVDQANSRFFQTSNAVLLTDEAETEFNGPDHDGPGADGNQARLQPQETRGMIARPASAQPTVPISDATFTAQPGPLNQQTGQSQPLLKWPVKSSLKRQSTIGESTPATLRAGKKQKQVAHADTVTTYSPPWSLRSTAETLPPSSSPSSSSPNSTTEMHSISITTSSRVRTFTSPLTRQATGHGAPEGQAAGETPGWQQHQTQPPPQATAVDGIGNASAPRLARSQSRRPSRRAKPQQQQQQQQQQA